MLTKSTKYLHSNIQTSVGPNTWAPQPSQLTHKINHFIVFKGTQQSQMFPEFLTSQRFRARRESTGEVCKNQTAMKSDLWVSQQRDQNLGFLTPYSSFFVFCFFFQTLEHGFLSPSANSHIVSFFDQTWMSIKTDMCL